jgi:hypothetical protein
LKEEFEVALNFLRRTITDMTKPTLQVIVISNLEEQVEIGPQPVIEEQLQTISPLGPMED